MKTKEELNTMKEEVETVNKKMHELTDEELKQVSGGKGREGGCACKADCFGEGKRFEICHQLICNFMRK